MDGLATTMGGRFIFSGVRGASVVSVSFLGVGRRLENLVDRCRQEATHVRGGSGKRRGATDFEGRRLVRCVRGRRGLSR
jgi:hypothetical protein